MNEIQNNLTDHFEVNRGLKKGHGPAPFLFDVALEYAIRQLSVDINSSLVYKSGQIVVNADDINIMRRSTQTFEEICIELEEHTKAKALTIDTMKV